jgi:anti-sigma factor RsiW
MDTKLRLTSQGWGRLVEELGPAADEPNDACLPEDALVAYCLNMASSAERACAEEHLRSCTSCAEEAEALAEARDYWEGNRERLAQLRAPAVGALREAAAEPRPARAVAQRDREVKR